MKTRIDNELKEIGPLKTGESTEKIINKVLGRDADPADFNDPIALKTSWSPAKKSGTDIQTHTLKKVETARLEFRASRSAKAVPMLIVLVGLGLPLGFSASPILQGTFSLNLRTIPPIVMGFILLIIAGVIWHMFTTPIVFDRKKGYFWKGRNTPLGKPGKSPKNTSTLLNNIHALQLISETCWRSNDRPYQSHELNLILKDGSRINVIDHGHKENIRESARRLSQFLGIPVWDALTESKYDK
jgi:hypothetical protein